MQIEVNVIGLEVMEGIGKKSGKPYSMGRIHAMTKLAPPMGDADNVAVGFMGDVYEADPTFIRAVKHIPCPFRALIEVEHEMRFGERREVVKGFKPVSTQTAKA